MVKRLKKVIGGLLSGVILMATVLSPALTVEAVTVYESDGCHHAEGYIFIGECHVQLSSNAMGQMAKEDGTIPGLQDISYSFTEDWSLSTGENGEPNTMYMKGNLFFVYESIWTTAESKVQRDKAYIYSDGKGKRGHGVERIHEIINMNPNIAHWNIIAYQGANAVAQNGPDIGDYYVRSYQNWIQYEFPEADVYFLSMSTMTKCYRSVKHKNAINDALAKAFPDKYLNYMDFFNARHPQEMLTPTDNIHWSYKTYQDLVVDVIQTIQKNRGINSEVPLIYNVTEADAVLYTNDQTVIYAEPSFDREVLFSDVQSGLPIRVTGVTDTGFFRVDIGETTAYIHGAGLIEQLHEQNQE